jgi:biopolymer transport protein ExbD
MSTGGSIDRCEPNLTPLLDMVLQLIMFFMLCANFVMEQVNESIKLPDAIAAKMLDSSVDSYHILNVDGTGQTLLGNSDEAPLSPAQVERYLKNQLELDKARTKPQDWEQGKGRSVIIIRGDKGSNFKMVHDVMSACRRAGYSDVQLRAYHVTAPGG